MERWAIYIDIEGFGATYEKQGLYSLRTLMEGIYLIGNKWCSDTPERIFAHQIGDGFIIVGEFGRDSLEIPIIIAIALMQQVIFSDGAAKAVIAEGDLADIQGCFPKCIRDECKGDSWVRLGRGLMTTFPVMGTALIRAVSLAKASPAGSLLLMEETLRSRIPPEIHTLPTEVANILTIDWIHTRTKSLDQLQQITDLPQLKAKVLEFKLKEYIKNNDLEKDWQDNTLRLLNIK
jgi:hypothetical protein